MTSDTDDKRGDGETTDDPQLTEYAELHGCSCKVGQSNLEEVLGAAGLDGHDEALRFGVGEDAAARQVREDLALVQTVDFFTPIVDDPYEFGRVTACNATSDAFATGATENLSCLVVLALPREITEYAPRILAGMADALDSVGGTIAGGHTTLNPWPIAGGAVTATAHPDQLLTTRDAEAGDRLYLTKPLGTQPAMGAVRVQDGEFAGTVREAVERPIEEISADALAWMTTPNRDTTRVAREYATAATDVTGFGLAGEARVLAENSAVGVEITRLPVIDGTPALSGLFGYGLLEGESAETSGGMLVSVPPERTAAFERDLGDAEVFGREIGRVTDTSGVTLEDPDIEPVRRSEEEFWRQNP